jgi:hypothetical protein
MQVNVPREREFLPLTDSLASRIRWRLCDYEAMLRAEVALLMLDNDEHPGTPARPGAPNAPAAGVHPILLEPR